MKRICLAILLVVATACSSPPAGGLPCKISVEEMPESWRPTGATQNRLPTAVWSASEANEAAFSIRTGVDEMVRLYAQRPTAAKELWEDSVASLIEVTYSGANAPAVDTAARDGARKNLTALISPYLQRDARTATCAEYEQVMPLAIHAHNNYESHDERIGKMVTLANASYRACGSVGAVMNIDYQPILAGTKATTDDVAFDMVIWSLLFTEAQAVPGLDVTDEVRRFPESLWRFLTAYRLAGASDYPDKGENSDFIETAYLATHIAYLPTGNHRFPIYVEDSPALYNFHRENFYAVLEMGELDLVAEFVDTLRQYGCTEENDRQVRDGTRYLINLFHAGGDQWMSYREPGETDKDVDNYDLVHKAWTGVLGVRSRVLEQPGPGNYGGVVREWLQTPP